MNKNRKGKPFVFPDSFILVIGYICYSFRLSDRQTEEIFNASGKSLPAKPSYGHICKRIKQTQDSLLNETKSIIKNRIDEFEKLTDEEVELLITLIRSLNNRKSHN